MRCVVNPDGTVSEIHKAVVYRFTMSDVDDVDIYVAQPIWEWQQSEAGKFIMQNAYNTPSYERHADYLTMGYKVAIIAELEKKKLSEFYLRFGKPNA